MDVLKAQNAALTRTHEEFSKSNKDGASAGGGKTEGGECRSVFIFVLYFTHFSCPLKVPAVNQPEPEPS